MTSQQRERHAAVNPYDSLSDALSLVFDALAVAQKGLLKNPSREEKRKLLRRIGRLEGERAEIAAKMDALEAGATDVVGPTKNQVDEIAALTGEVEAMTRANLTASAALALTSRIMTLATEVADA